MTLLLAIKAGGGNWSPEAWRKRFSAIYPDAPIVMAAETYDPASVKYAACWKPEPGFWQRFPTWK